VYDNETHSVVQASREGGELVEVESPTRGFSPSYIFDPELTGIERSSVPRTAT
jgi:hypothetical protein